MRKANIEYLSIQFSLLNTPDSSVIEQFCQVDKFSGLNTFNNSIFDLNNTFHITGNQSSLAAYENRRLKLFFKLY